ncbi:hypothetical protein F5Y15DRAFT_25745 [Xylariaceae sp. FL0016]|nr:hypothetical protein F5Y15DRAFT_25745 [Xylariaceae sp. FL0016]
MSSSKDERDEEEQAFLPTLPPAESGTWSHERRARNWTWYFRLALDVFMAVTIAALLARPAYYEHVDGRRSPVPKFSQKTYTYLPDPHYVKEDMLFDEKDTLSTLHNWIPLSAKARGYVQIPDHASYPTLSPPYTVALNRSSEGPAYMMSVFHQLHCLSYLVSHYQQGYAGAELTEDVAHHSAHCFDYLRQSIMCAADTNLEGATDAGPGWGSEHVCKDYEEVLRWADERGTMAWRNGLLPGEAIL